MSSRDFKRTVKTVSRNFQKYTQAMEADIQVLIYSMLDLIETKIIGLRKLLKLKLCIKNVRSIAGLEYITNLDDASINHTYSISEKKYGRKGNDNGSLEDLSSIVYEVDKNSLPPEENSVGDDKALRKLRYLEDIADIESLCSALNHHSKKLGAARKENLNEDARNALDKYIYMLLDAERQKQKNNKETEAVKDSKTHKIGDYTPQLSNLDISCAKTHPSHDSVVYLDKTEYESILDILNMVLRSYKMQEEIAKRNRTIEKTKTEPSIGTYVNQPDERKILSDSTCQQKDSSIAEKKIRNRKSNCI